MTKKTKVSTIYSVITQNICLLLNELISILKKKSVEHILLLKMPLLLTLLLFLWAFYTLRYYTKAGKRLPSQVHLCIVNRDNKLC